MDQVISDFDNDRKQYVAYNRAIDNDNDGTADVSFNEIYFNNKNLCSKNIYFCSV